MKPVEHRRVSRVDGQIGRGRTRGAGHINPVVRQTDAAAVRLGLENPAEVNRDLPIDEEPYRTALQMAEFLDGVPRYPKMHPCGLVL